MLRKANELNVMNNSEPFDRFGTKSISAVRAMVYHNCEYFQSPIAELKCDRVVFENGSEFECDTIVCCTGFKMGFDLITIRDEDSSIAPIQPWKLGTFNARNLFKHTYDPLFGDSIAFIGYNRPILGSLLPLSEFSARYHSLVLSGKKSLPTPFEMRETMKEDRCRNRKFFPLYYDI